MFGERELLKPVPPAALRVNAGRPGSGGPESGLVPGSVWDCFEASLATPCAIRLSLREPQIIRCSGNWNFRCIGIVPGHHRR
jgi:hypothetical protein